MEKGGGSVLDLVSSCIVCTQDVHCSGLKWMLPSNFASQTPVENSTDGNMIVGAA